jgi:hypothetical protein
MDDPSLALFNEIDHILQTTTRDRIQLIIPLDIQGQEEKVLLRMKGVAEFISSRLPNNWALQGYGACSPQYKTARFGQGVDVILSRTDRGGYTISRFRLTANYSWEQFA